MSDSDERSQLVVSLEKEMKEPVSKKRFKKKRKYPLIYENLLRESILSNAKKEVDEDELELEKMVFGGEADILDQLVSKHPKKKKSSKKKKTNIEAEYIIDRKGETELEKVDESAEIIEKVVDTSVEKTGAKAVWQDEDDEKILVADKTDTYRKCHRSMVEKGQQKYKEYAREMFFNINGDPKWAKLDKKYAAEDSSEESEEEEKLLQKTGNFLTKSIALPKRIIDIRKCQNLTEIDSTPVVYKSVEFHPTSKVALVAGLNGIATLYQVDGKVNAKIQSVHFEHFPISTAHFTADGNEIVVGSRHHGHYFTYDMIQGKIIKVPWEKGMEQMNVRRFKMSPDGKFIVIHGRYGNIHIVSSKSKEWIGSLKMNGEVLAITFSKDGSRMYSHGESGQIYVWDMRTRQCIHKFNDEGCITGSALALSPNEQYLAAGSDSGVVNIYNNSSLLTSSDPKPMKVVMNLTTEISSLKFNCTSEILAMASSHKKESVRLVHFPSMTVFSNFPNQEKKLHYVNSLDLSLNSGYLMLGNNVGRVYLYRLRHFGNY